MTDFCVLYKFVLCILYDLSIVFPLSLCYIIARKGDTNVQVKTLECKKKQHSNDDNFRSQEMLPHVSGSLMSRMESIM